MSATEDELEDELEGERDTLGDETIGVVADLGRLAGAGLGLVFQAAGWLAFFSLPALLLWLVVNAVQWGVMAPLIASPPGTPDGTGLGLLCAVLGVVFVVSVVSEP